MNYTAVVATLVLGYGLFFFDDTQAQTGAAAQQLPGCGQSHNAGTYDDHIKCFHTFLVLSQDKFLFDILLLTIIGSVVQSPAFLAQTGRTGNQVTNGNQVAQLAQLRR